MSLIICSMPGCQTTAGCKCGWKTMTATRPFNRLGNRDIVERLHRRDPGMGLYDEAAHEIVKLRDENMRLRALFADMDAEMRARVRAFRYGYD